MPLAMQSGMMLMMLMATPGWKGPSTMPQVVTLHDKVPTMGHPCRLRSVCSNSHHFPRTDLSHVISLGSAA